MSSLHITPGTGPLPGLGHGLWVNQTIGALPLLPLLRPSYLDLLVDLREPDALKQLREATAMCQRANIQAWWLVIVADERLGEQLQALAECTRDVRPRGLLVTPAAYLLSYQPDAVWPAGPTPTEAARVAREFFPDVLIGGGVPTYFTELNRCRPAPGSFDYLTHAVSPIVHAAEDEAVMQTLQALPDVFRSGQHLAQGRPYRLTTSGIGAWCNPYGGQLSANPRQQRMTLSNSDPRHKGLFAAAWTLGCYRAAHLGGLQACALWALHPPMAMAEAGAYWPLFHLLRGLAAGRGLPPLQVHCENPALLALGWQAGADPGSVCIWVANLTAQPQVVDWPRMELISARQLNQDNYPLALHDPDFLSNGPVLSPAQYPRLPPYAIQVVHGHLRA